MTRFALSYSPLSRVVLPPVGLGPRATRIEVDEQAVAVRAGKVFQTRIPRARIERSDIEPQSQHRTGVHGSCGQWTVLTSRRGVVRLRLASPVPASALGVRVQVVDLRVSVDDCEQLVELLRAHAGAH